MKKLGMQMRGNRINLSGLAASEGFLTVNIFRRNQNGSSALTEFVPALSLVLAFFVFIFLNVVGALSGVALGWFIAQDSCNSASTSKTFDEACNSMSQESTRVLSCFGSFPKLKALNGYRNTGSDLFMQGTNIYSNQRTVSNPNEVLPNIDPNSSIYQFETRFNFEIEPICSLAGIPIFKDIPGLGSPCKCTCSAVRTLDNPNRFAPPNSAPGLSQSNQVVIDVPNQNIPINSLVGWNYSQRKYPFVLLPGQVISDTGSAPVYSTNANWTTVNDKNGNPLVLKPGQRLSVQATLYLWRNQTRDWSTIYGDPKLATLSNQLLVGALECKIGEKGEEFQVQQIMANYQSPQSGTVYFRFNDSTYQANLGLQQVNAFVSN